MGIKVQAVSAMIRDARTAVRTQLINSLDETGAGGAKAWMVLHDRLRELERQAAAIESDQGTASASASLEATRSKSTTPTFLVEGDSLVKVADSRNGTRTYQQRAPRESVLQVVDALREFGSEKEFRADELIKRTALPAYLIYLVLGALQHAKQVRVPRRGTYKTPEQAIGNSEEIWQLLRGASDVASGNNEEREAQGEGSDDDSLKSSEE